MAGITDEFQSESFNESTSIDDVNLGGCFSIPETGQTNQSKRRSKLVYYKSPIPKTKLTRALLGDNVCDERKLQANLDRLSHIKRKTEMLRDRHRLLFEQGQERKRNLWQKDDSQRLQKLNLPQIHPGNRALKSASLSKLYEPPKNLGEPRFSVPLLPVMVGEDEKRIVEYRQQIFLTRLPTTMELSSYQQDRYERYKGTRLLQREATHDDRFTELCGALSERKSTARRKRKKTFFLTRASTFM